MKIECRINYEVTRETNSWFKELRTFRLVIVLQTYFLRSHMSYNIIVKLPSIYMSGPAHWSLGQIDGLLVPPGKASKLLTDHLITG